MSLSDYIRYLRATRGGITPWEIGEATGLTAGTIHLIEVKHRRMGEDNAVLEKLAEYFEVPVAELSSRREAYRKRLALFLDERTRDSRPIAVRLEDGEVLAGKLAWYSREAVALNPGETSEDPYIVQRSWIADWRLSEEEAWEVASAEC